jgi:hypothetical protein
MVIDLQVVTPPKANSRKIYPDTNGTTQSAYYRDQLSIIKTNLLNPAEVTFNVNDVNRQQGTKRKRLTTISSEASDTESFGSNSTNHHKKKIPDGGYGEPIIILEIS